MGNNWQVGNVNVASGASVTLSVVAGDLIVALAASSANCTFSDNSGVNGSYTTAIQYTGDRCRMCVGAVLAKSTASITITATGGTVDSTHAMSARNLNGIITATAHATASGATSVNTVNVTTTKPNCLLIGIADASTNNDPGTGFTTIGAFVNSFRIETEYSINANTAGSNTVNTINGSPARGIAAVAFEAVVPSVPSPTFFGVASAPADNSAQTGPGPLSITPPSNMVKGDLVVVFSQLRQAGLTPNVLPSNLGGQRWNYLGDTQSTGSVMTGRPYWCTFNGTWSANPSFVVANGAGTGAMSLVMHVFRSADANAYPLWLPDLLPTPALYSAPSTPFTVTIASISNFGAGTVSIGAWFSEDDNTWGTLSGSGWSQSGLGSQYRNSSGTGMSMAFAYRFATEQSIVPAVSLNQATLGGDQGFTQILSFTNAAPITAGAGGDPVFVQSKSGVNAAGSQEFDLTPTSAITAGNHVAYTFSWEASLNNSSNAVFASVDSVRDDRGNVYRPVVLIGDSYSSQGQITFLALNVQRAPTKITARLNVASANPIGADMVEFSGGPMRLVDANGIFSPENATTTPDPGPIVNAAPAFVYAVARNTLNTVSIPYWTFTSWGGTKREEAGGGGTAASRANATLVQTSPGTLNCVATQTTANSAMLAAMMIERMPSELLMMPPMFPSTRAGR